MFDFLKWFRKPTATEVKPQWRRRPPRLLVEAFESRDVPSASSFGHAFGALSHSFGAAHVSHFGDNRASHGTSTSNVQQFSATLTGDNGATGAVNFTLNSTASTNTLKITATGLGANQKYDVQVDGTSIGSLTTDAKGSASTTLRNITATIAAGSTLTVADTSSADNNVTVLTGTFAEGGRSGGGCHHFAPTSSFAATLTGATGTSGNARYHTDDSTSTGTLRLRVAGLTAGTDYTIQIDGTTVGTLTTDANGAGHTKITGLTNTITADTSTVTVLDSSGATALSGTFATTSGRRHFD